MGMKANSGYFIGTSGSKKYELNIQKFATNKLKMPNSDKAITPKEKFDKYSLDYSNPNQKGKAEAYEKGLGYTTANSDSLVKQIHEAVSKNIISPYENSKTIYGKKYKYRIPVKGPNGKTKYVIAVYQIDKGSKIPRLVTNYLEAK